MNSWKVENQTRLLSEIKNKFSGLYTTKDLRWSIEHNRCFVNKHVERFGSATVKKGDMISIQIEKCPAFIKEKTRTLYEDYHILVYDKPPHVTSEKLAEITETLLVHRLDRDTSGVILLAKNKGAQSALEMQFHERTVSKDYFALVEGKPGKKGTISGKMSPLQRREGAVLWGISKQGLWSKTEWKCLRYHNNHSLLQCKPLTGRTHQIRVHLKHIGYPIVGDYTYGSSQGKPNIFRPLLHANRLTFAHPITQAQLMFSAPLPLDLNLLLD